MPRHDAPDRAKRIAGMASLLLAAAYALPLFFPPAAQAPELSAERSVLERIFPGVPAAWVGLRLLALGLVGALVARWAPDPLSAGGGDEYGQPARGREVRARPLHLALAVSLVMVAGAFSAELFPRGLQLAYVACLGLPLLLLGDRGGAGPARRALPSLLLVIGLWIAWRSFLSFDSPRAADAIDTWEGLESLEEALAGDRNLLTASRFVMVPDANLFLQGLPLVDFGLARLSAALVQAFHLLWLSLAGLMIGVVAARRLSPCAAPVATAALLFSPFCLMIPVQTLPYSLGPLLAACTLLALSAAVQRGSAAGLVALPLLLGLSTWHPAAGPLAALGCGLAALLLLPRFPQRGRLLALGLLLLGATLVPGFANRFSPDFFRDVGSSYAAAGISWSAGEWLLLGQTSLSQISLFVGEGASSAWDVVLGSLATPFAIARTPMRLLGDTLLDPLSAVLAAAGLALCLGTARRGGAAAFLLAALAASLVTGFLSSYDRPSLTRLSALPVVTALLAAVGFESLRRCLGLSGPGAAGLTCVAIAAGGGLVFDVVNPRILPRSSLGITLESLAEGVPRGGAALLRPEGREVGWRHQERIATSLAQGMLPVRSEAGLAELVQDGAPELLFWSPRLERDAAIGERICRARPGAALYRLEGPTGLAAALAARPGGSGWAPGLPEARWRESDCTARGAQGLKPRDAARRRAASARGASP